MHANLSGSRDNNTEGDAKGAAVTIAEGGGGAHPIAVESAVVNPGVGGADSGFAGGGVGTAFTSSGSRDNNVEKEAGMG